MIRFDNLRMEKLNESERHQAIIDAFSCVETGDMIEGNAKTKRKIINHSKEIDEFLKTEALIEQESGFSVTHLFMHPTKDELIGYISLCNDNVNLDIEEKNQMNSPYSVIPALKIARVGVSIDYRGKGIGKDIILTSVFMAVIMKNYSGIVALTLDCYAHKLEFYEHIGFTRTIDQKVTTHHDPPISMQVSLNMLLEKISLANVD